MIFSMDVWREKIKERLSALNEKAGEKYTSTLYALLAAGSLLPVIEAIRIDPASGFIAFGGVAAGVGSNLLANLIQQWRDRTEVEQLAEDIDAALEEGPQLREELATIMKRLNTISIAQECLDLKNLSARVTGDGTIVQGEGNQASGKKGISAHSVTDSILQTGDTIYTVENQIFQLFIQQPGEFPILKEPLEKSYLQKLRSRCLALPLTAMGSDDGPMNKVNLDKVYIAMDTETRVPLTEKERAELDGNSRERETKDKPLPIFEAARESLRLVILGDPGGGKSTFVKQLAALLADHRLRNKPVPDWGEPELPVLIDLRNLLPKLIRLEIGEVNGAARENQLVSAFLEQCWENLFDLDLPAFQEELKNRLEDQPMLFVFDGLDEVPEIYRPLIRETIRAVDGFNKNRSRIIVTCRKRSYSTQSEMQGYDVHKLAFLTDDQKIRFIDAWYNAQVDSLGRQKVEDYCEELQQAVRSGDLLKLSRNPMLLTTMAIILQKNVGLPKERVKLFSKAVALLLRNWQKHRSGSLPVSPVLKEIIEDDEKLRRIVENLAYRIQALQAAGKCEVVETQGSEVTVVDRGSLLVELEQLSNFGTHVLAGEFLDYIDFSAGLIIGHGGTGLLAQHYSFPHRIFQEYLAGCRMVRERDAGREFEKRAKEGDFWHVAAKLGAEELRYNYPSLHHVFDLAETLSVANPADNGSQQRAVLWSGHMARVLGENEILADSSGKGAGYLTRLKVQLITIMEKAILAPAERAEAGRILARIGDSREEVMVPEKVRLLSVPRGSFTMGAGGERFHYAVAAFSIARFPVTNAQFQVFVKEGGYAEEKYWQEALADGVWQGGKVDRFLDDEKAESPYDYGEPFNLANHPVVGICWYETLAYCRWLTERLHSLGTMPGEMEVRLPFEPEWEKAARGDNGQIYPWAGDFDSNKLNSKESRIGSTSAVGCFRQGASPFRAEDMVGNVWEWTASVYGDYPYPVQGGDLKKRQELSAGRAVARVLRGGAYWGDKEACVCASRVRNVPGYWNVFIGFRVVCAPKNL